MTVTASISIKKSELASEETNTTVMAGGFSIFSNIF